MPKIPSPEDFMGNPEPSLWTQIQNFAKNNDEYSAALLSLKARVELLEGQSKPVENFDALLKSLEDSFSILSKYSECPKDFAVQAVIVVARWLHANGQPDSAAMLDQALSYLNSKA